MVKREDICHGIIQVLGLVQERLSVESCDILVKVDREEVQGSLSIRESVGFVLNVVVEMIRSLGGQRAHLLVASRVAGNEEDGNSLDL